MRKSPLSYWTKEATAMARRILTNADIDTQIELLSDDDVRALANADAVLALTCFRDINAKNRLLRAEMYRAKAKQKKNCIQYGDCETIGENGHHAHVTALGLEKGRLDLDEQLLVYMRNTLRILKKIEPQGEIYYLILYHKYFDHACLPDDTIFALLNTAIAKNDAQRQITMRTYYRWLENARRMYAVLLFGLPVHGIYTASAASNYIAHMSEIGTAIERQREERILC